MKIRVFLFIIISYIFLTDSTNTQGMQYAVQFMSTGSTLLARTCSALYTHGKRLLAYATPRIMAASKQHPLIASCLATAVTTLIGLCIVSKMVRLS